LDIVLLRVERIREAGIHRGIACTDLCQELRFRVLFTKLVSCNGCSAGTRVVVHTHTIQFPDNSILVDSNMACAYYKHMAAVWNVVHERSKSSLANEWKSSEPAHTKWAPHIGKFLIEISIDLIRTATGCNKKILVLVTLVFYAARHKFEDLGLRERSQAAVDVADSGLAVHDLERTVTTICRARRQQERAGDQSKGEPRHFRCHLQDRAALVRLEQVDIFSLETVRLRSKNSIYNPGLKRGCAKSRPKRRKVQTATVRKRRGNPWETACGPAGIALGRSAGDILPPA
jgi:hypothetical protein